MNTPRTVRSSNLARCPNPVQGKSATLVQRRECDARPLRKAPPELHLTLGQHPFFLRVGRAAQLQRRASRRTSWPCACFSIPPEDLAGRIRVCKILRPASLCVQCPVDRSSEKILEKSIPARRTHAQRFYALTYQPSIIRFWRFQSQLSNRRNFWIAATRRAMPHPVYQVALPDAPREQIAADPFYSLRARRRRATASARQVVLPRRRRVTIDDKTGSFRATLHASPSPGAAPAPG